MKTADVIRKLKSGKVFCGICKNEIAEFSTALIEDGKPIHPRCRISRI